MRSVPGQFSLSSGEVSPLLRGRPDYQRHQSGARTMRGFLPLRQGGATRAPGTFYRGATRNGVRARLLPFEFARNDAALLEFAAGFMRVWRYGALVMDGASPFELATGFSEAEADGMQWEQSADVTYLATGTKPIKALRRLALDDWEIGDATFSRGPFMPENLDESLTVTSDGNGGTVTLTASGPLFVSGHVGGLFLLRTVDDDTPEWTGNVTHDNGDRVVFEGRIYQSESPNGTTSGVNPPRHSTGSKVSGTGAVEWRFIADGFGVARIVAVSSATEATAFVTKRIPPGVIANGTWRWAEGAWSPKNGYPAAIAIHDQRFVAAGTPSAPRTVWFSALGDFADMEPTDLPDGAFAYDIASGRSRNAIVWLQSTDNGLSIGTLGEEHASASTVRNQAISIENAAFFAQSTIGSRAVRPVAPRGAPIIISRDGRRVFELRFDLSEDKRKPVELSLPADHFGAAKFLDIAWQGAPMELGWITRESGEPAILVSDPAEEVLGWASLPVAGGDVVSLAVTTDAAGQADVVTAVVRRTIGGGNVHYIEEFAPVATYLDGGLEPMEVNHLFAASRFTAEFDNIAAITVLDHLEGQDVLAWTNKGVFGPLTVQGGRIEFPEEVSLALVGLFDDTHLIETLDLAPFAPEGSTLGRQRAARGLAARLHRTLGLEARPVTRRKGRIETEAPWQEIAGGDVRAPETEGVSGVVQLPARSGHAPEVSFQFRPVGPLPATILAIAPVADVTDG